MILIDEGKLKKVWGYACGGDYLVVLAHEIGDAAISPEQISETLRRTIKNALRYGMNLSNESNKTNFYNSVNDIVRLLGIEQCDIQDIMIK